jgi:hypothetical protein
MVAVAFDLQNDRGEDFRIGGGPWAVYLNIVQAFGYKLPDTQRPDNLPEHLAWHGRYDSNDGQYVPDADALSLAGKLNSVFHHAMRDVAISDTIEALEHEACSEGLEIPDALRIRSHDIVKGFPHLMNFLCRGGFRIN